MGAAHKIQKFEEESLIDERKLQSIKDLGEGDDSFFIELTDLFFERVPTLLQEIRDALDNKNAYKLERSSHALKGTSGNLGAIRMMKICEYLETMGREQTIDGLDFLVDDLHHIYPEVEKVIRSEWLP